MATAYDVITRQVALRINAFSNAAQPAQLQTAYTTALTAAVVGESSIFPFAAIEDAVIDAEAKLAQTIADVRNHPWRAVLFGRTAGLASGAGIPDTAQTGESIIGVYGGVVDDSDGQVLSEQPEETIRRRLLTSSLWKIPVYQYSLTGDSIIHTRTFAYIEVCVWDDAARRAAILASGNMLLPDVLAEAVMCGAIALLVRDDEMMAQAEVYATYFATALAAIRGGAAELPIREAA